MKLRSQATTPATAASSKSCSGKGRWRSRCIPTQPDRVQHHQTAAVTNRRIDKRNRRDRKLATLLLLFCWLLWFVLYCETQLGNMSVLISLKARVRAEQHGIVAARRRHR